MSFIPSSISLTSSSHFAKLWEGVGHISRKIDGKFQLIEEALQTLEGRSNSYYPAVTKVNKVSISVGGAADLTITGVNFSADEALISVTVGGQSASITAGASTTVFHATLTGAQAAALGAAGDSVIVMVRVNGVLAQPFILPLVA